MSLNDFASALAAADQIPDIRVRRLVRSALMATTGRLTRRRATLDEGMPVDLVTFGGYLRDVFALTMHEQDARNTQGSSLGRHIQSLPHTERDVLLTKMICGEEASGDSAREFDAWRHLESREARDLALAAMIIATHDLGARGLRTPSRLRILGEMFGYAFGNITHLSYLAQGGEPADFI